MTKEEQMELAAQLRKPSGKHGVEVATFMNEGNELLNRNVIQHIEAKPNLNIVELGMGNGKFVTELFEKYEVAAYHGCDYSEEIVLQAQQLNASNNLCSFHHCNAQELPFNAESIDVIFTVNTIYFWEDVTAVLQEFHRVLKSSGQLLIGLRPRHLMQDYPFTQYGFNMFEANEIVALLEERQFQKASATVYDEPDFIKDDMVFPVRSLVISANKE